MKNEVISILKLGIKNCTISFAAMCIFYAMRLVPLPMLLLETLGVWITFEVVYFIVMRLLTFIENKLNNKEKRNI